VYGLSLILEQKKLSQEDVTMKVETPQILWNNEADKGINAPLLSIDILGSGIAKSNRSEVTQTQNINKNQNEFTHVLVTSGNAACINLWRVSFGLQQQPSQQQTGLAKGGNQSFCSDSSIFQNQTKPLFNKIDYMMSLTRHDVTVNSVAFSPDGLHLATAGDSGNIVVWSVPVNKRGNNNGRHFWFTLSSEKDLTVRIVSTHCEGIVDISWSTDSKRFTVGTIDSCVLIYEDKQYGINACSPETHRKESDWQLVFRNADQHGSFVQGVAYDPLDVYIASMGGDRTVRVFPRKVPLKSKKKVLRPANTSIIVGTNAATAVVTPPPHEHQRMVSQILTEAKLELGKPKRIKQRSITVEDSGGFENQNNVINLKSQGEECRSAQQHQIKQIKHKLFVDESNCESFFRRLNWTVDGAFLITPAALWHGDNATDGEKKVLSLSSESPLFSTYLFARHRFEEPYRVLTGLDKPSVVVRANPVLFQLPPSVLDESKENQYPLSRKVSSERDGQRQCPFPSTSPSGLPYRSIFAVLTLDSILIYDTHHAAPLSVLQGLHYSGLTDCCWSSDGLNLMVCSSDGYISIVNFADGELGKVYNSPTLKDDVISSTTDSHLNGCPRAEQTIEELPPIELSTLPPCDQDPSQAVLVAPAAKKARKMRITPTLVSNGIHSSSTSVANEMLVSTSEIKKITTTKRAISETEIVGEVVTKLSLNNNNIQSASSKINNNGGEVIISSEAKPKKKKKRVQPFLVSSKY
jgi:chromatin assembly factor 1 subunit B